jgi:GNAT superfamily N-acetyltransferase
MAPASRAITLSSVVNDPQGFRIERFEPTEMAPARLREAALFQQALQHERVAEDPLLAPEAIEARMLASAPGQWRAFSGARDKAGAVAGYGVVFWQRNDPRNQHLRWCEIAVARPHRRRGLGRALLRRVLESVAAQGDDLVFMCQVTDRLPASERFARAMGASAGLEMKTNQLDLATVDRTKVGEWAAIAPAGYRLERVDGPVPGGLIRPYIEASSGMNDAPRGDLRMDDWELTEEQIRDRESWQRQAGSQRWLILAVHEASGAGAGFTEVSYDPRVPHLVWQQGTAVIDAHRGHHLGLWMKAVMLQRILAERTHARCIRTGNANTNAQMLAINTQLGFKPAWSAALWQLTLADARKAVGLDIARATA